MARKGYLFFSGLFTFLVVFGVVHGAVWGNEGFTQRRRGAEEDVKELQEGLETTSDVEERGMILTYLSLAYQKLGRWEEAKRAIADSLEIWSNLPIRGGYAQALNTQGQLELALGRSAAALKVWQQATQIYGKLGDEVGVNGSLINQSQALQSLGLYQQALTKLTNIQKRWQNQPNNLEKLIGLRSLGNALGIVGDLEQSRQVLESSLAIAQELKNSQMIADILVNLGNTAQSQQDFPAAEKYYLQANQVKGRLNLLQLLLETQQWDKIPQLIAQLQPEITNLSPSRTNIYARINYVQSLVKFKQRLPKKQNQQIPIPQTLSRGRERAINQSPKPELFFNPSPSTVENESPEWVNIAQEVAIALQQAKTLGDVRGQSYALGTLGTLYEQTGQFSTALQLTQQALLLAQSIQATDIYYRWQWQLGRLYTTNPQTYQQALAAYQDAVTTLASLRTDLVAINPEVQFTFRDSVEPVYREYVSLLLRPVSISQDNLIKARNAIESLQLAELENFFRQACLDSNPVQIDQIDPHAAVFYPIILSDRLEVIVSLPNQSLRHYTTNISQIEIERTLRSLRSGITNQESMGFLPLSQQMYDWLIRPIAGELDPKQIKTLVFILDGSMRNIPISALHDGKQYLLEKYGIAIAPGLQLIDVKPLKRESLRVLAGGLSQARQGFEALPSVAEEIEQIQAKTSSQVFLNEAFTSAAIGEKLNNFTGSIVHLATHGEFSSQAKNTFILTWDGRININDLGDLLRNKGTNRQNAIELLVLSACRTALGDNRAALGLAGVAVRAGARSTIGSLWYVSDEATSSVMVNFYQQLTNDTLSKTEALRRSQLTLLNNPEYKHPYFWSPFILVGNWL
ncbi:CHAT domain-containing protein [Cronbergia sp. UHCC 0137]|uniref:CHAT domain-containing protein n=1 Tax=Cronbergia sp. UHCC 0137 TaxID=3110239 RepID=UPI002B1EF32A|nr:CHAT domain-containing protein [Cronbergia sp. UHCC 0137]MEA5621281.1 CHAT domain-containing protein [Cronbergia sp. UHCC 0137]